MPDQALNSAQLREVEQVAELCVRRYFDRYLTDVFPRQQQAIREETTRAIAAHESSTQAHGGVENKLTRVIWLILGIAVASGGSGAVVGHFISLMS